MTLIPKSFPAPDFAVRITDDLLAEKGQWVLVFRNHVNPLQVMNHADVTNQYDIREGPAPVGAAKKRTNGTGGNYGATISDQGLRVLQALLRLGGNERRVKEICRGLSAKDTRQASARLAQALHHGLVRRHLPEGRSRGFLWTLTDQGRAKLANIANQEQPA